MANKYATGFKRKHGFQSPLEFAQICTFIFFGIVAVVGTGLIFVEFWKEPLIIVILLVIFVICFIATFISAYIATKTDPAATVLPLSTPPEERKGYRRCYSGCEGYVKSGSYHCRKCGKCSEGFDHHCLWLNNCIGSKNYVSFVFTLISVDCYLTVFNGVGIYVITTFFVNYDSAVEKWGFLGGQMPISCALGPILLITIVFAMLVLQLLCFHLVLIWKGTATYKFLRGETKASDTKLLDFFSFAVRGLSCKRSRSKVAAVPPTPAPDPNDDEVDLEAGRRAPHSTGSKERVSDISVTSSQLPVPTDTPLLERKPLPEPNPKREASKDSIEMSDKSTAIVQSSEE